MTAEQFYKIEKNKKFRRHICSKGIWKNYAFVPPSILLFCGLFGLIYLFNADKLISWISIPFIIVFLIGTIWFKSTRKYLIKERNKEITSLKICTTIPLYDKKDNKTLLFTSNNNRNNINYLENKKNKIIEDIDIKNLNLSSKSPISLNNNDFFIFNRKKENPKEPFIVLINDNQIKSLNKKEFIKYK